MSKYTYSAAYTNIVFHPNDGTDSTVIATAIDPYLADRIANALNYRAWIKPDDGSTVAATLWAIGS